MKQVCSLLSFTFIVIYSFAQGNAKQEWSSASRYDFIRECIKNAKVNMSTDTAKFYCYCMQEKVEAMYPDTNDVNKLTKQELSKPEWKKNINACLSGTWPAKERDAFMKSCVENANSLGEEKAKNYCECMMYKMETFYPNVDDAAKVTAEDLKSERWQKILKSCLNF